MVALFKTAGYISTKKVNIILAGKKKKGTKGIKYLDEWFQIRIQFTFDFLCKYPTLLAHGQAILALVCKAVGVVFQWMRSRNVYRI